MFNAREWAIATGVLKPASPRGPSDPSPMVWLDVPTLRLDDLGLREARRHARQGPTTDSPTHYNTGRFARGSDNDTR